jgi:hypothetical protein
VHTSAYKGTPVIVFLKDGSHVRQDEFRRYIADEVNPARAKHGLTEIRDDEARECFRILDKFFAEWRATGNTEAKP